MIHPAATAPRLDGPTSADMTERPQAVWAVLRGIRSAPQLARNRAGGEIVCIKRARDESHLVRSVD